MLPPGALPSADGEPQLPERAVRAEIFGSSRRLLSASPPRGRPSASPPPPPAGLRPRSLSCRRPREPRGSLHGAWIEREEPVPLFHRRGFSPPAQLKHGPEVRDDAIDAQGPGKRPLAPPTQLLGAWPPTGKESHEEHEAVRRIEIFTSAKRLGSPIGLRVFGLSSSDQKDVKSFLEQAGDAASMPRWPVLETGQVMAGDFHRAISTQTRLHSALTRWPAPAKESPRQPAATDDSPRRPHEEGPCRTGIFGSPRRQLRGTVPAGHLRGGYLAPAEPSLGGGGGGSRAAREASPRSTPGPPGAGRPERPLPAQRRHGIEPTPRLRGAVPQAAPSSAAGAGRTGGRSDAHDAGGGGGAPRALSPFGQLIAWPGLSAESGPAGGSPPPSARRRTSRSVDARRLSASLFSDAKDGLIKWPLQGHGPTSRGTHQARAGA
uniref:Uncharacterized protein n=1 Tax=Alexandrium monilatum TaxID=311494 RepID=A0A7S4PYB8_9DINO